VDVRNVEVTQLLDGRTSQTRCCQLHIRQQIFPANLKSYDVLSCIYGSAWDRQHHYSSPEEKVTWKNDYIPGGVLVWVISSCSIAMNLWRMAGAMTDLQLLFQLTPVPNYTAW